MKNVGHLFSWNISQQMDEYEKHNHRMNSNNYSVSTCSPRRMPPRQIYQQVDIIGCYLDYHRFISDAALWGGTYTNNNKSCSLSFIGCIFIDFYHVMLKWASKCNVSNLLTNVHLWLQFNIINCFFPSLGSDNKQLSSAGSRAWHSFVGMFLLRCSPLCFRLKPMNWLAMHLNPNEQTTTQYPQPKQSKWFFLCL